MNNTNRKGLIHSTIGPEGRNERIILYDVENTPVAAYNLSKTIVLEIMKMLQGLLSTAMG
ncbi:hypothetical protein M0657_009212 [Pyricularia oryzae]|uniref:Uncharacterized protein n=2 Tax=Pyricularia oryzae TaxID=318829 RepID=A0A4V1C7C8_PYROR|nr:hypothetical protein M0657_009212 [Pyricularia oryzae]KAI7924301.1 hypothetical protein M9X92_003918 [Pyricularia oryzae]QBZ62938.1 hypothetical protein PoMZ_11828 [Pyricularia oryzae]